MHCALLAYTHATISKIELVFVGKIQYEPRVARKFWTRWYTLAHPQLIRSFVNNTLLQDACRALPDEPCFGTFLSTRDRVSEILARIWLLSEVLLRVSNGKTSYFVAENEMLVSWIEKGFPECTSHLDDFTVSCLHVPDTMINDACFISCQRRCFDQRETRAHDRSAVSYFKDILQQLST